jgi:hypothetical protein
MHTQIGKQSIALSPRHSKPPWRSVQPDACGLLPTNQEAHIGLISKGVD